MSILRRRARPANTCTPSRSGPSQPPDGREPADARPDFVREWVVYWDADRQHVAATGEHLDSVMWNDDGAVGVRGWYY